MSGPISLSQAAAAARLKSVPGSPDAQPAEHRASSGAVVSLATRRRTRAGSGASVRRWAEERAFLPAALEVIETPASPSLRLTAAVLCALFAAALAWACLARIDMVAVAEGKVIPRGQVKVLQPLETAMVRAILVEEGDHVAAGQTLVELDPTEARADLDTLLYDQAQATLDAEVARVLQTLNPKEPLRAPPGADAGLIEQGRAQATSEIEKQLATIAGLEADLAQKAASLAATQAVIERATLTLPLLEEKLATHQGLYEKRYGPRPPVLDAQQQVVEKQAELKSARESVRQAEAEMRSIRAKIGTAQAGYLADANDRRTKALQKLAQLTQSIAKARQRESYRRLVAPVSGTVQGLKVHTPGAVVTTADVLMTVVPHGTGIEIDAQVLNKDVGFVTEGQRVEVKFEAFPFTRYGLIGGTVRRLGRDAVPALVGASAGQGQAQVPTQGSVAAPGAPGAAGMQHPAGEFAYPARVSLDRDWIETELGREAIRPGMRVAVEINTGYRRVIELLLSPVLKTVKEAGRER